MTTYANVTDYLAQTALPGPPSRKAASWRPNGNLVVAPWANGVSLQSGDVYQVVGPRAGRHSLTIANTGANPATLGQQRSDFSQDIAITILAGGVWEFNNEDQVLVSCQNGTTLDVSEEYTPIVVVGAGQTGTIPSIAADLP